MTTSLVIGGGSIGARHARLLEAMGDDVVVVTSRADLPVSVSRSVREAVHEHRPSYAVIATQTSRHGESVNELLEAGFHGRLLVEKPLAIEPAALPTDRFERVGVAFNLRFHPVIDALRTVLQGRKALAVEVYAGQHLSTWRPSRSLAEQYSAHRGQGGGVLRDLSHELDYLQHLFGGCRGLFARGGRLAEITVDSDDAWGIVAEFEHAPLLTLQLNYLDTRTRRRIVVNTGDMTIEADLVAKRLTVDGQTVEFDIDADESYRRLHRAMRSTARSGADTVTTVDEAARTDLLIDMIERSATERRWLAA